MKHELGEWSLPNTNIHWRGQPLTLDSDERHHYICTTFTPERCTPPTPLPRLKPQLNLKPRRSGIKCFFKKGFFHIHKSDGLSLSKLMGGRSIYCLKKNKKQSRLAISFYQAVTGMYNRRKKTKCKSSAWNGTQSIFGNTKMNNGNTDATYSCRVQTLHKNHNLKKTKQTKKQRK